MPQTDENRKAAESAPQPETQEAPQNDVQPAAEPHAETDAPHKKKKKSAELTELETQNQQLSAQLAETKNALLRLSAEFDNYKKRTARERDGIYTESVAAAVSGLLPVLDNLERAAAAEGDAESVRKGVEMTLRQMKEALSKLNVTEIEVKPGDPLDPEIHNAMMRVEDDALPPNSVAEVLMKGYRIGDKVIRYSMVKSAN